MAKLVRTIKQLFSSNTRESLAKFVGTDQFQNKFYERLPGNRHYNSSRRFYEPANYSDVRLHIDPAWEAWLRGTRKDPPTFNEIIAQENRRQQLSEKPIDMLSTSYGRDSAQGGTGSYPIQDDYEISPGTKSRKKQDPNETH
ncbi:unnamed protein product [Rotaria sp. Silwood2]|nr:unnamed protein product [Rotaria sp. Silwood2]CAF2720467.1 unnamed protein product [Rotaria sp. Silwood2]CAF2969018.1 unnamed protein product [Rotaria sp. Silwood2]CAF3142466.1 unnamed protein product [Rotaria sp. Silwood2]CAF3928812.1 unnamed protein product [Rotaria sp. Silwood2]